MNTVNLTLTDHGTCGRVVIDGAELEGVYGFQLAANVEEFARLNLELITHEVEVGGEVQVVIPESTRESLIALGWTPPAETGPTWRDVITTLVRSGVVKLRRRPQASMRERWWGLCSDPDGSGWLCRTVYDDGTVEWGVGFEVKGRGYVDYLRDPTPAQVLAAAEALGLTQGATR